MITVILNRVSQGQTTIEIKTLTSMPNYVVPSFTTIDNHNYEVRGKNTIGNVTTFTLSDSGVNQN